MINLSKRISQTIKQNIAFALLYNTLMLPSVMMAKVIPLFAAIAMHLSSLEMQPNFEINKDKLIKNKAK
jgi:Cu2+-exporting ATPase